MTFNITITNAVMQNGGDAAITYATIELLKHTGVDHRVVQIEDQNPTSSGGLYPQLPIARYPFPTVLGKNGARLTGRIMRLGYSVLAMGATALNIPSYGPIGRRDHKGRKATISVGGTYLIPKYDFKNKLLNLARAKGRGDIVILSTQSLGPFGNDLQSRLALQVLDEIDLILLRDNMSEEHLRSLGVSKPRVAVIDDSVFAMRRKIDRPLLDSVKGATVGISVRDCSLFQDGLDGEKRYRNAVRSLCTELVRRYGCKIVFVSTCQGVPGYRFDDAAVARSIMAALEADIVGSVTLNASFHSPERFSDVVSKLDLYVSTRLHGAIQALNVGTPVLPIAYEFKTRELWSRFGLSGYLLDLSPNDPVHWLQVLTSLNENAAAYSSALREKSDAAYVSAMSASRMIAEVLEGRPS